MTYPIDEETFTSRTSPEFIPQGDHNGIIALLKRIQDFLGYGGRLHDVGGLVMPVGSIIAYGAETSPDGWVLCDGALYAHDHADYADLFAIIGYDYGEGTASYFRVPDLRGYFIRGWDNKDTVSFDNNDITAGTDEIDFIGGKFTPTGSPVRFTTDDTLPSALAINTTYYIITQNGQTCQLATSRANAIAGTQIDIDSDASGTSYVHPYQDDDIGNRLKLAPGGNDAEDIGSWQKNALQGHQHQVIDNTGRVVCVPSGTSNGPTTPWATRDLNKRLKAQGIEADTATDYGEPNVKKETVPTNVLCNYIIKI